jgi:hypothetical protein
LKRSGRETDDYPGTNTFDESHGKTNPPNSDSLLLDRIAFDTSTAEA